MQEFEGFVKMSNAEYKAAKKNGYKIFGVDRGLAVAGSVGFYGGKPYLAMKDTYDTPGTGTSWKLICEE